jgi:hypothetical protein
MRRFADHILNLFKPINLSIRNSTRSEKRIKTLDTAVTLGSTPYSSWEKIRTGSVMVLPPVIYMLKEVSSKETINANRAATIMPGRIMGKVTFQNV